MSDDEEEADAPFADLRAEIDARMTATESESAATDDESDRPPLDELAASIETREPGEGVADLFEEAGTTAVDAETVWDQLEAQEPIVEATATGEQRVVPKADYCDSCPYLSDPPEMTCTHEGTEIVELVDFDHVAVQNCPIVKENEELDGI